MNVVVTSPPYNIGIPYKEYDDSRTEKDYLNRMRRFSRAVRFALSEDGSFFLNLGGKPSDPGWPIRVIEVFRRDFQLQNTILWVKSIAIGKDDVGPSSHLAKDLAVGHYKPVNSDRYLNPVSEYVFHLTRRGDVSLDKLAIGVPYSDKSNVKRWSSARRDLRDRGSVWFIPYDTIQRARAHPCVFPVRLPQWCILLHGLSKTRLVMDPFVGTGSTGIASKRLGVSFVGFEIDPYYASLARRAISQPEERSRSRGPRMTLEEAAG